MIKAEGLAPQPIRRKLHVVGREFRIGMLGPVGSGKTTYLAVLDFALARVTDSWVIRGANPAAELFGQNVL